MAKTKGKGRKVARKAYYTAYKATGKAAKNAAIKLARHVKKHPNDAKAASAVGATHKARTKPQGKKVFVKPVGIQEIAPGTYSYVSDTVYHNGHPALMLMKGVRFDRMCKLGANAKFTKEALEFFKGNYAVR
jgi:hypothetical protein